MSSNDMLKAMWNELTESWGVSEETVQVVTDINGYNEKTMRDILYATNGVRTFEFEDEDDEDDEDVEDVEDERTVYRKLDVAEARKHLEALAKDKNVYNALWNPAAGVLIGKQEWNDGAELTAYHEVTIETVKSEYLGDEEEGWSWIDSLFDVGPDDDSADIRLDGTPECAEACNRLAEAVAKLDASGPWFTVLPFETKAVLDVNELEFYELEKTVAGA